MLCSLSCADLVLIKAQNAVNPFGLTSILTKSKGKSATINRGSDYYRYPKQRHQFHPPVRHQQLLPRVYAADKLLIRRTD